jgi:hypothetical protein
MTRHDDDNRTIGRWRIEPRPVRWELDESSATEQAPLWKDLTVASAVAVALWAAAAIVFG